MGINNIRSTGGMLYAKKVQIGITILAMERSGIKLNEYWLDKKEFVRKQANN